jgi:hypothetical protein
MNDTDKLTLELFTNKTQYKKYLSKMEPDNYNETKNFQEKCIQYKTEILKKTEELLLITDFHSNFINNSFYRFTSELIKEIEMEKDIEKDDNYSDSYENQNQNEEENEDMLFPPDKMIEKIPIEKHSFWGKERVIQQNSNSDFIAHYPTNTLKRRLVGRRNSILPKNDT